jgi:hypothetical protein
MSKSKSTSAQTSATTDNRVVADGEAIVATGGSTINYLSDDVAQSALEAAVELGKSSLALSGEGIAASYDFADKIAIATETARVDNNNLARDLASEAIRKVEQNAQSADVQVLNTVGKYAAIIAGAIAALVALFALSRPARRN